jgi:hypothetical protein
MRRRTFVTGLAVALTAAIAAPVAAAQFNLNPDVQLQLASQDRIVTIQQANGLRMVDAWDDGTHDWTVVTRNFQNNDSQKWQMTQIGGNVYTFKQLSSGRYLDAHETGAEGYVWRMVTRPQQNNQSQQWLLVDYGGGFYTMQNVLLGRYADNTLDPALDFHLMTSEQSLGNNSQTYRIIDTN